MKAAVCFYLAGVLALAGFLLAGITAGATLPVSVGFAGLLGTLIAGAARISLEDSPGSRAPVRGPV